MPCHQPCWTVAGKWTGSRGWLDSIPAESIAGCPHCFGARFQARCGTERPQGVGITHPPDGDCPCLPSCQDPARHASPLIDWTSDAATRSWSCSKSPLGAVILVGCPYAEETGREAHRPEQVLSTCPATVMPYLQSVNDAVTGAVGGSAQPNQECGRRSCDSSSRTLASRAARASRSVLSAASASSARTSAWPARTSACSARAT